MIRVRVRVGIKVRSTFEKRVVWHRLRVRVRVRVRVRAMVRAMVRAGAGTCELGRG